MKVLHYFSQYLSETMHWAPRLLKRVAGARMFIAAPRLTGTYEHPSDWQFIMPWYQQKFSPTSFPLPWGLRLLSALDQKIIHGYKRQIVARVKKENIQVLHAHFADAGCKWIDFSKKTGLPLVVSFYGVDYYKLPNHNPALKTQYQELFKVAAAIIVEGPHGAGALDLMGCAIEKIHIVPFGVDPLPMAEHVPKQKKLGALNMLQAATFTPKKGQINTVNAFAAAVKECPNLKLSLVGEILDPAYYSEVVKAIAQHQLQDKVTLLPFVPPNAFAAFVRQFDVFIQPSVLAPDGDCEGGAPVALLDVQRLGLPIIATDHCDIPFVTAPDQSALISSEHDLAGLIRNIKRMYHMSEAAYSDMSAAAIRHVHLNFMMTNSGQKLMRIYEQVGVI